MFLYGWNSSLHSKRFKPVQLMDRSCVRFLYSIAIPAMSIALNNAWNVSIFGVILVQIFPNLDWIRGDTPYLSVYGHFLRSIISIYIHLLHDLAKRFLRLFRNEYKYVDIITTYVLLLCERKIPGDFKEMMTKAVREF